ncbi:hypothetical protein NEUTE1DRAFT_135818 [Neurospora tetrasperma FGSC 2508]|uniref:Uncharacterized protein n=1 Tax=Neurospora tetrasperma (strain FGSC 2508 / ATCC MYA-4615 / P0657) TaxID=510951 RepID=F8MGZ9_NEUT8|nr:uncharacterized protein NEUTE1DRAFT_135818 [Neurospora tetrasperma FGSC 2508]EGO58718.1 hypothetical protein NEUTE1DRAFT_135818 [Neurospora tetrasperma FGSC 2508]EGZ72807.1 hypothetical protein NEUTE2DRAFT_165008 [Neurospora tetrasperma FGSC 2509]
MSFTADKTSSGLTARQLLGLDDNAARNNSRNDDVDPSLPSHAAYVPDSDRSACCEDTRRKLELNASIHESDLESNGIPPPTHCPVPNSDSPQGYRPEPNPTQILSQLQRMLEDEDEDKDRANPLQSTQMQPERTPPPSSSFDREAWLATRPTIADLITPRPLPPPPPIPPPKTYSPLTEFCLRHNSLCCWPCSDGRDKLPALEVYFNQLVNSNKPRYQQLELVDENGKIPERQVWMSSCPVMLEKGA